jgi:hypothetical protein
MGMPVGQVNAHLEPGLVMRVGIPHRGGKLAFHAFQEGYAAMVSANAFWSAKSSEFQVPSATDLAEVDFALDSAGFTAMKLWQTRGAQRGMAGVFPWTMAEYVEFASRSGAAWWAQPDLCCEPELAHDQAAIDWRVNVTATLLEGALRTLWSWQEELARTCNARTIANLLPPPVPVLQGWSASDYLRSLDLMLEVWGRWEPWLAPPVLIGIGSVCRRSLNHPTHGLYAILSALDGRLPRGSRVHLFGVKGQSIEQVKRLDWVASLDSMAYDFGARMAARKARISNTLAHRQEHMTEWMQKAAVKMRYGHAAQASLDFPNVPLSA